MEDPSRHQRPPLFQLDPRRRGKPVPAWRMVVGISAVTVAAFFMLWLILGTLGGLASPLEVFGIEMLRVVSGAIAGGLLLASLVFADF